MTRRTTRSTAVADGRELTRAERAQQGYLDGQLEGEAQRVSAEAKRVAAGMRGGILAQVARLLSGRW